MTNDIPWRELFRRGDHIRLALALRDNKFARPVRILADDEISLMGGAKEAARLSKRPKQERRHPLLSVVSTPLPEQSEAEFVKVLDDLRNEHPEVELSGYSPRNTKACVELFDRVVVQLGEAGRELTPLPDWRERLPLSSGCDLTITLVYTPEVSAQALEQSVKLMLPLENLVSVVPLPLGAGDRIPLPGLTTSGSVDMMVVSTLRHLLPASVRVRASWAALGWKVAQMALLYGADELAGWTAAETLAYSGRVRSAARVEKEELVQGLEEAGRSWLAWPTRKKEDVR